MHKLNESSFLIVYSILTRRSPRREVQCDFTALRGLSTQPKSESNLPTLPKVEAVFNSKYKDQFQPNSRDGVTNMFLKLFTNIQSRALHVETQRAGKEEGAVAVEYALLVVLVAIAMGVGAKILGKTISDKFGGITL
jgi:Flp pilus assembly pilin Flp